MSNATSIRMTRAEREAALMELDERPTPMVSVRELCRAVDLEREACAKLVDEQAERAARERVQYWAGEPEYTACVDAEANLRAIAAAIRNREDSAG